MASATGRFLLVVAGTFMILELASPVRVWADDRRGEETKEARRVHAATEKGVKFLLDTQVDGNWEDGLNARLRPGGMTAMVILALLDVGLKPDDPAILKALDYLRNAKATTTYVVSLQTMVLCRARLASDKPTVEKNLAVLLKWRRYTKSEQFAGWGYGDFGSESDNSNTHFVVMALHEAALAGFQIEGRLWKEIQEYSVRSQKPDGGWTYRSANPTTTRSMTYSMTYCLLVANRHLKADNEVSERELAKAYELISRWLTVPNVDSSPYYTLHALGRMMALADKKRIEAESIQAYKETLLKNQRDDGSWKSDSILEKDPALATSYALSFLANARTVTVK